MTRFMRLWFVAAALLAVLLFAACGGDDDDGNGNGNGGEPTAAATDVGGTPGDGGGNGETSGDVEDDLRNIAANFGLRESKISYEFSAAGTESSTMTFYWKPPSSWRVDIGAEEGDISVISTPDGTYTCFAEGGEGQCFQSPGDEALPVPFLDIFTDPAELNDLIDTSLGDVDINRDERSIAGQDATCYSVSGEIEGEQGSAEYCFSGEGLLLLLRAGGSESGEFSMEATSVETSVSDSDLEPIYDIVEIPGLP